MFLLDWFLVCVIQNVLLTGTFQIFQFNFSNFLSVQLSNFRKNSFKHFFSGWEKIHSIQWSNSHRLSLLVERHYRRKLAKSLLQWLKTERNYDPICYQMDLFYLFIDIFPLNRNVKYIVQFEMKIYVIRTCFNHNRSFHVRISAITFCAIWIMLILF